MTSAPAVSIVVFVFKLRQIPFFMIVLSFILISCTVGPPDTAPITPPAAQEYEYTVIASYPHDPAAFTQGLVFTAGQLYEGTGLVGKSSLRRVALTTGEVLQSFDLPAPFFGEGVTVLGERIYQLTWQSYTGFVYDRATFAKLSEFSYATEGWGLTHDGQHLIMSDGTLALYYLDPGTLQVTGHLEVQNLPPHLAAARLNELEYTGGKIYANVWPTPYIVIIDAKSGNITGWADLSGLTPEIPPGTSIDVLNGIAYDAKGKRLFVTGKLWPRLYEIKLTPKAAGK